jgi:hypothetical protein
LRDNYNNGIKKLNINQNKNNSKKQNMKKLIITLSFASFAFNGFSQQGELNKNIKKNLLQNGSVDKLPTIPPIPACSATNNAWLTGGNTLSTSYSGYVFGTCNSFDLVFETNGVSNMWLKTTGQLGIGTATPNGMLDVVTSGTMNGLNILNGASNLFSVGGDGTTLINSTTTTNSSPFTVQNAGTNLLQVTAGGKIGINNVSPAALLDIGCTTPLTNPFQVEGNNGYGAANQFNVFTIKPDGSTIINGLSINTNDPLLKVLGGGINYFQIASTGATTINGATAINAALSVNTTNALPFSVINGTINLLQVASNGIVTIPSIKGNSTTGGYNSLLVDATGKLVAGGSVSSTNSVAWNVGGNSSVGGSIGTLGTTDNEDLIFVAGTSSSLTGTERMRITAAGNTYLTVNSSASKSFSVVNSSISASSSCGNETFAVYGSGQTLIGGHLTSGAYTNALLQVRGQIAAEEVHVLAASFWCDFVFDKEYKLQPLKELEAYYKQNKHLPDVPSEAEVKENGIDMATMDAVLLKKVEESTLYIVQQQKELDAMKEEMKSMKKENEEMKNILAKFLKK